MHAPDFSHLPERVQTAILIVAGVGLSALIGYLVIHAMLTADPRPRCEAQYDVGPNGVYVTDVDCLDDRP